MKLYSLFLLTMFTVSFSAEAACPSRVYAIKAFAGYRGPVAGCREVLRHANGQVALNPRTGEWFTSQGQRVFNPRTRTIYFWNGRTAFNPRTVTWFHMNGRTANRRSLGDWYYASGRKAYDASTGNLYYENGQRAGNSRQVREIEMLYFVGIL